MGFISNKGDIVLFGVEATYGAISPSITRVIGELESFTPPSYNHKIGTNHQLSTTAPSGFSEDIHEYTGGKMTVVYRRGDILEHIIGAASDAAGSSNYVHTVSPDDIISSISIALGRYDTTGTIVIREVYLGSVISSLGISCKKGQKVKMEISFECQKVQSDTTAMTAAFFTDEDLLFKGSTLTIVPAAGGSTTTISTIVGFDMGFKRKIKTAKQLNSLLVSHKSADEWDSDCSFDYYFTDSDTLELFHGGTGSQDAPATEYVLDFICTNGLSAANLRKIEIRGSSSKLGTFSYGNDGGFSTGKIAAVFTEMDVQCTDATTDWVA